MIEAIRKTIEGELNPRLEKLPGRRFPFGTSEGRGPIALIERENGTILIVSETPDGEMTYATFEKGNAGLLLLLGKDGSTIGLAPTLEDGNVYSPEEIVQSLQAFTDRHF